MPRGKKANVSVPTTEAQDNAVSEAEVSQTEETNTPLDSNPTEDSGSTPDDNGHSDEPSQAEPMAGAELSTVDQVTSDIDAFLAWAASSTPIDDLGAFVQMGFLNEDHSLTDVGCTLLDSAGVAWRTINMLTLGVPLTYSLDVTGDDGIQRKHNFKVEAGSTLRVLHGGYDDSLSAKFWVCEAGDRLPKTQVYQNRLHKFHEVRYPLAQPLEERYEHANA